MNNINELKLGYHKGLESLRYWELKEVVVKLSEQGIPVMLLKGAVELIVPDYRPPGSLPLHMRDIDLFIRYSDWEGAVRGLNQLGYRLDREEIDNKDFPFFGQREFIRDDPPGRIDLHHDLNKFHNTKKMIDNEGMWERAIEYMLDEYKVFVPSITDHMWYKLVHLFFFHIYSMEVLFGDHGLVWDLISIADYNRERIDWRKISSIAKICGAEIPLHFLVYGMKSKYNEIQGIEVDEEKIMYVAKAWKWTFAALNKPRLLTHALGRYTVINLIREYNAIKVCKIYFTEIVKNIPKEGLLQKYRVSKLPFLYPIIYLIHFFRLILLHWFSGAMHIRFMIKERRNK